MKHAKTIGLAAFAVTALMVSLGNGTAVASVLVTTPAIPAGTEIEASLEGSTSIFLEDVFGLTATTCTASTIKGKLERSTPTGQPKGKLATLDFSGCGHTVDVEANGELEIRNIAGTTNGTVFSSSAKVKLFNTLLNQVCVANTGAGTDVGILTAASTSTSKATLDLNGLIPLEGCSASNARLTGKYEVTNPIGLAIEN